MTNDITKQDKHAGICPHCGAGEEFLRRQVLAKMLDVDPKTLANWTSAGIGPRPVYFANRLPRYRKSDWMKEAGYWAAPVSVSGETRHTSDIGPGSPVVAEEIR